MDTDALRAELGLSASEYERRVSPVKKSKMKLDDDNPNSLAYRRKEKWAMKEAKKENPLNQMSVEEKARRTGVGLGIQEPFWNRDSNGVISYVKRKQRCPVWTGPEKKPTMVAQEKPKNFMADISKKTKGARGKRKNELMGAALEVHDKHYKFTDSEAYIAHYQSLKPDDAETSKFRTALMVFETSWQKTGGGSPIVGPRPLLGRKPIGNL